MAYKKFPVTAHDSYKNATRALQERFEPESCQDAKFQTRYKVKTEGWPEFGEDLRCLVDKAYPSVAELDNSWHCKDICLNWIMNKWLLV